MTDGLGADLDYSIPQAGQRPIADRLGQQQGAQDVGQVIGQGVELRPDLSVSRLGSTEAEFGDCIPPWEWRANN